MKATEHTRRVYSNLITCYSSKLTTGKIDFVPKEESIPITWGTSSILQANLMGYRKLLALNQVIIGLLTCNENAYNLKHGKHKCNDMV